jgi:hypothetical protein
MSEWQPMVTAPKDGTQVLGWCPEYYRGKGGMLTVLYMHFSDRPGWYSDGAIQHEPTQWQPLPSPPAALSKEPQP